MEFKEFLVKHGVLQEFCNEVRRQINKAAGINCTPPDLRERASIMGLHWRYTNIGRTYWENLYHLEVREVTQYAHTIRYYYELYQKIPKCLKRL